MQIKIKDADNKNKKEVRSCLPFDVISEPNNSDVHASIHISINELRNVSVLKDAKNCRSRLLVNSNQIPTPRHPFVKIIIKAPFMYHITATMDKEVIERLYTSCKFGSKNVFTFGEIITRLKEQLPITLDCAELVLFHLCLKERDLVRKLPEMISQFGSGRPVSLPSHPSLRYIGSANGIHASNRINLDQRGQWLIEIDGGLFAGMSSHGPRNATIDEWKAIHIESIIEELKTKSIPSWQVDDLCNQTVWKLKDDQFVTDVASQFVIPPCEVLSVMMANKRIQPHKDALRKQQHQDALPKKNIKCIFKCLSADGVPFNQFGGTWIDID